jgi:cytidine deaminase
MNFYKNQENGGKTVHAECAAINKLPNRFNKATKKINILVIRTTKTGKLSTSKPCYNCIMNMNNDAPRKGYKIEWVYYSNEDGSISKEKLSTLSRGNFHISSFYKYRARISR